MKPDNTPLNADDKLHDAIYGIAELNVKNIESCEMMYAVRPSRLIKFIKEYELKAVRDYILSLGWQETDNEYVAEVLSDCDRIAEELDKLKEAEL